MKLKAVLTTLTALLITFNCVAQAATAQKANFAGKWMMDRSRSEGLPPEVDQIMTVSQSGDQLTVETKVYPENTPYYTIGDNYVLNGQEVAFEQPRMDGTKAKGKRTAKWSEDGKGVEIAEELIINSPKGPVTIQTTRKWMMLDDGKTLTIELNQKTPERTTRTKRTFVKKD
jgi:hypothetical protein